MQNKWITIDDHLEEVVSSLENIQMRIPKEVKQLAKFKDVPDTLTTSHMSSCFLTKEDVNFALSYDLLQHEKMLAAMRKLLSDLTESLQMIGRKLNEAFLHYQTKYQFMHVHEDEYEDIMNDHEARKSFVSMTNSLILIDEMNEIFLMLSRELYRKQCLSNILFDVIDDNLLNGVGFESSATRRDQKARSVFKSWSRKSKDSCLAKKRFSIIMKKGITVSK